MIVTFNPMINNSATVDAAYANFLRCVTAACTAAAGAVAGTANSTPTSTNLSVVPYLNNTGSQDVSYNCIISVDANTEAGGWTTSSAHNVPSSATFTAIASAAAYTYKADFYNSSGKATYPYNKLSFYATGQSSATYTASPSSVGGWWTGGTLNPALATWATYPAVRMLFGCSSNSAWTAGDSYTPVGGTTPEGGGTQTTSWTLNTTYTASTGNYNMNGFYVNNTSCVYKIAVTANYCIVWQQHSSNSYASGYTNTLTPPQYPLASYGMYAHLMYGGLRETQTWENSYADNPPWVAFQHISGNISSSLNATVTYPQSFSAFMRTLNNSGVASGSSSRYVLSNTFTTSGGAGAVFSSNVSGSSINAYTSDPFVGGYNPLNGLQSPPWYGVDDGVHASGTNTFPVMPTVDPATGTLVPSAYPIVIRRNISDSWNPGGAVRGIYKSLGAPLATLKLYWGAANQTFTIGNDQYIPIVFGSGDMFLIRYA